MASAGSRVDLRSVVPLVCNFLRALLHRLGDTELPFKVGDTLSMLVDSWFSREGWHWMLLRPTWRSILRLGYCSEALSVSGSTLRICFCLPLFVLEGRSLSSNISWSIGIFSLKLRWLLSWRSRSRLKHDSRLQLLIKTVESNEIISAILLISKLPCYVIMVSMDHQRCSIVWRISLWLSKVIPHAFLLEEYLAISALALAVLNCSFSCLLEVLLITNHNGLELQLGIFTVQAQICHRTVKLEVKICLKLATF